MSLLEFSLQNETLILDDLFCLCNACKLASFPFFFFCFPFFLFLITELRKQRHGSPISSRKPKVWNSMQDANFISFFLIFFFPSTAKICFADTINSNVKKIWIWNVLRGKKMLRYCSSVATYKISYHRTRLYRLVFLYRKHSAPVSSLSRLFCSVR